MRPDQERVKNLLTDTVTLLCKNGLQYNKELKVQGLLGITLDNDDVFVVHINEIFEGLVGGQLMGITAETSAVAAADSATQPAEVPPTKSRKATPHRHDTSRNSSPLQGSMKRKAFNRVQVKREVDDDLQVLNTKEDNFIPGATDLSGDGDREAMRMSYGGLEGPPTKKLAGDSGNTSDTYSEEQATGGPFIAGIAHSLKENDSSNNTDTIGLDDSRGSGQPVFQDAAGCSDWDPTQGTADNTGDNQANDSDESPEFNFEPPSEVDLPEEIRSQLAMGSLEPGTEILIMSSLNEIQRVTHKYVVDSSKMTVSCIPVVDTDKKTPLSPLAESSLKSAEKEQDTDRPFVCHFTGCKKTYQNKRDLNRHLRQKHINAEVATKLFRNRPENLEDRPYLCGFAGCASTYLNRRDVLRHYRSKHSVVGKHDDLVVEETLQKAPPVLFTESGAPVPDHRHSDFRRKSVRRAVLKTSKKTVVVRERQRRSSKFAYEMKQWPCPVENCSQAYYHRRDLYRHQKEKHAAIKMPERPQTNETMMSVKTARVTRQTSPQKKIRSETEDALESLLDMS